MSRAGPSALGLTLILSSGDSDTTRWPHFRVSHSLRERECHLPRAILQASGRGRFEPRLVNSKAGVLSPVNPPADPVCHHAFSVTLSLLQPWGRALCPSEPQFPHL